MEKTGVLHHAQFAPLSMEAEQQYRHHRVCRDLYHRALIGPIFYVLAYLTVLGIELHYRSWTWYYAFPIAAFLLLGWLRYQHKPLQEDANEAQYLRWFRQHWIFIFLGVFIWGIIAALVPFNEQRPSTAVLVTMIITIAICTAASQTFAMHPIPARWAMIILLLPPTIICALPSMQLLSVSVTLLIYSGYLFLNLHKFSQEYQQQIELEIELMRSRAELAYISMTDGLTNLRNRLCYEQVWPQLWHTAQRQRDSLAILVLDLDHFKQINDQHGHLVGDACLRHFAKLLQRYARRESDFIARIGGEEFVMLLTSTSLADAWVFAEKVRLGLEGFPYHFNEHVISMTVSIGVGLVDWSKDLDPDISFQRVDHACYLAKHAGRNCSVQA